MILPVFKIYLGLALFGGKMFAENILRYKENHNVIEQQCPLRHLVTVYFLTYIVHAVKNVTALRSAKLLKALSSRPDLHDPVKSKRWLWRRVEAHGKLGCRKNRCKNKWWWMCKQKTTTYLWLILHSNRLQQSLITRFSSLIRPIRIFLGCTRNYGLGFLDC